MSLFRNSGEDFADQPQSWNGHDGYLQSPGDSQPGFTQPGFSQPLNYGLQSPPAKRHSAWPGLLVVIGGITAVVGCLLPWVHTENGPENAFDGMGPETMFTIMGFGLIVNGIITARHITSIQQLLANVFFGIVLTVLAYKHLNDRTEESAFPAMNPFNFPGNEVVSTGIGLQVIMAGV